MEEVGIYTIFPILLYFNIIDGRPKPENVRPAKATKICLMAFFVASFQLEFYSSICINKKGYVCWQHNYSSKQLINTFLQSF